MPIKQIQDLALTRGLDLGQNWRVPDDALLGLTDAGDICAAIERYGCTQGQKWIVPLADVASIVTPPKPPPAPAPVTKKKVTKKTSKKETGDAPDDS